MVKGDLTSMNKTIIAIDGNINTGKTSLFEKFMLAYPSASFSREYQPVVIQDDLERQLGYLAQDIARTQGEGMIFLDRSILSLFAYIFWCAEKGRDIRRKFYQYFICGLERKLYALPDIVIYCMQDYEVIRRAFETNRERKQTSEFLAEREYCQSQERFYKKLLEKLNHGIYIYDYKNHNEKPFEIDDTIPAYELLEAIQYAIGLEDSPNVISLNGTSAIGKSTICQLFETRGFHQIDEVFCVDETNNPISFFDHQIDYYLASSARYKKIFYEKVVIDNGFIETISYTFYLASTKGYGIEFLKKYFYKILSLENEYTLGQTFYLMVSNDVLIERKKNDSQKNRKFFIKNISFRDAELELIKILRREFGPTAFTVIDASENSERIFQACRAAISYSDIDLKELLLFLSYYQTRILEIFRYYADKQVPKARSYFIKKEL